MGTNKKQKSEIDLTRMFNYASACLRVMLASHELNEATNHKNELKTGLNQAEKKEAAKLLKRCS